jgi:hypothetical protein
LSAVALQPDLIWQTTSGSACGASHLRTGAPNQDFVRTIQLDNGLGAVLAVADGHGDPLHARSDRGSRFAIEAAIAVLTSWIISAKGSEEAIRGSSAQLPKRILEAWRAKVISDLENDPPSAAVANFPFDKSELIKRSPELLYGSTLVAAAVSERLVIYIQIGDGDLLTVHSDNIVRREVPVSDPLPPSRTESLCQSDAEARFRVQVEFFGVTSRPELVLASTDGYCNSYAGNDAAFLKVASDIKMYLDRHGLSWIEQRVEGWLKETSETGSGDDITVALAWHGPKTAGREKKTHRRSWRLLAVFILSVAILLVWTVRSGIPANWKQQAITVVHVVGDKAIKLLKQQQQPVPAERPADPVSDPQQ